MSWSLAEMSLVNGTSHTPPLVSPLFLFSFIFFLIHFTALSSCSPKGWIPFPFTALSSLFSLFFTTDWFKVTSHQRCLDAHFTVGIWRLIKLENQSINQSKNNFYLLINTFIINEHPSIVYTYWDNSLVHIAKVALTAFCRTQPRCRVRNCQLKNDLCHKNVFKFQSVRFLRYWNSNSDYVSSSPAIKAPVIKM